VLANYGAGFGAPSPSLVLLDGRTGALVAVPAELDGQLRSVAWSADGEWLFVQDAGSTVQAWHVGDERTIPLPDLPGDRLLGARG
jgi:hypothetical protein